MSGRRSRGRAPRSRRAGGRAAAGAIAFAAAAALLTAAAGAGARSYEDELRRLTDAVDFLDERCAARPGSWADLERAAAAYAERARLSGRFGDYVRADRLLDEALALAPRGAGPHLSRARLDFTLHRFDRVEASLRAAERAVILDDPTRSAIVGLRADVAFQRGEMTAAWQGFEEALRLHRSPEGLARLAKGHEAAGRPAVADSLYREAAAQDHGPAAWARAWYHVQRAAIDEAAGNVGAALAHVRDAEQDCPGWSPVDERAAHVLAAAGRRDEAIERMERAARRTERVEPAAALADLLRERGDAVAARRWDDVARVRAERLARELPEAARSHGVPGHGHPHSHSHPGP